MLKDGAEVLYVPPPLRSMITKQMSLRESTFLPYRRDEDHGETTQKLAIGGSESSVGGNRVRVIMSAKHSSFFSGPVRHRSDQARAWIPEGCECCRKVTSTLLMAARRETSINAVYRRLIEIIEEAFEKA